MNFFKSIDRSIYIQKINKNLRISLVDAIMILLLLLLAFTLGFVISVYNNASYLLIALVLLVILIFKPFWFLLFFVALIPAENVIKENFQQIIKILGFLIIFRYLVYFVMQKKKILVNSSTISLIIFIFVCFSSLLWSLGRTNSLQWLLTYFSLVLFTFILIIAIDNYKKFQAIQISVLIGSIPVFISGFIVVVNNYISGSQIRFLSGFLKNYNLYFIIFLFSIPSAYILIRSKSLVLKLLGILYSVLFGITALFTYSRGGLIAFLVFLFMVLSLNKGKITTLIPILLVLSLVYIFTPDSFWARFLLIGNDPLVDRLTDIWPIGIAAFIKSPILGYGVGSNEIIIGKVFNYGLVNIDSPHNGFLSIAMDLGLLGLIPFLTLTFSPFLSLVKKLIVKNKAHFIDKNKISSLILLISLSVSMYLTVFKGGGMERDKLFWLLIGLQISYNRIIEKAIIKN